MSVIYAIGFILPVIESKGNIVRTPEASKSGQELPSDPTDRSTASLAPATERAPRGTMTVPVRGLQNSFACLVGSMGRCPSLGKGW